MKFVVLILVALVLVACGEQQSALRERLQGLRLDVPKKWSIHRLGAYCHGRIGPGLLITNLKGRNFTHNAAPGECTNAWDVSKLPKDFVLIDISQFSRSVVRTRPVARRFPIQDSELQQTSFPRLRALSFWNGNRNFTLRVWTGDQASSGDRKKLVAFIKSVQPE